MPQGDPRPGEKYLHFKNKLYQVIAIAQHSETGEKLVVYQALYGTFETYARPLSMFISPVDKEKYPQVQQKHRFQWVEFRRSGAVKPESGKSKPAKPEAGRDEPVNAGTEKMEPVNAGTGKMEPVNAGTGKMEPINAGTEKDASVKPEPLKAKPLPKEMSTEDKMLAFFDADTAEDRYKILLDMRGEVTDRMINNMAVVLDVVIEEGPLDLRYEELKACLRTMQRYECSRLRTGRGN